MNLNLDFQKPRILVNSTFWETFSNFSTSVWALKSSCTSIILWPNCIVPQTLHQTETAIYPLLFVLLKRTKLYFNKPNISFNGQTQLTKLQLDNITYLNNLALTQHAKHARKTLHTCATYYTHAHCTTHCTCTQHTTRVRNTLQLALHMCKLHLRATRFTCSSIW